MRHISVVVLITVFLCSGPGAVPSRSEAGRTEPAGRTMIALDLMDLEIPGEGGGDEMALPPIQGADRSEAESAPPEDSPKPPEAGENMSDFPPVSRSVPISEPGLAPFMLEEPGLEAGTPRSVVEPTLAPAPFADELAVELKKVPPPPSRAERLKLPSGMETRATGGSDVPEIPLLKGEGGGQQAPVGQDSSLTMKPLPDLSGRSSTSFGARPSRAGRQPQDYLQIREDMDARLVDLYERHYKDR